MIRFSRVFGIVLVVGTVAGCDNASFRGLQENNALSNRKLASSDTQVEGGLVSIGVTYEESESESLNLVTNALVQYTADLVGGAACWGNLPTPFTGSAANVLKVRKDSSGCKVKFKDLRFKEGQTEFSFQNTEGLESTVGQEKVFTYTSSSDSITRQMNVKVVQAFVTSADSEVKLVANKTQAIQTSASSAIDESVSISANANVAAYPHVNAEIKKFNGKLYASISCISNSQSSSSCLPAIAANSGGSVNSQPLSSMKAALLNVTESQISALSITRVQELVAATTVQSPTSVTGYSAKFEGTLDVASKNVFVVIFTETVNNQEYKSYKLFKVNGL